VAVADNRAQRGQAIDGVPVMTPAEASSRYGRSGAFVVTTYNTSALWDQLERLGCERVISYGLLYAAHADRLLPFMSLERTGHDLLKRAGEVRRGFALMADEASRREYLAQVRARLLRGFDERPAPVSDARRAEEYFPADLYSARDDEVLVDAGAYDGDTIRRFLKLRGGRFAAIHALEPDAATHERLRANVAGLGGDVAARIRTHRVAAAAEKGSLGFHATGDVAATASAEGAASVPCDTLDALLASGPAPTLIKMDLEGGEPDAIAGASGLISRHAPVLAICVYHRQDHLWSLPLQARALRPDYRFYLRAHAEACWDTSFYAVPPERSIKD
jgi:FkbM family methyltransferase